MLRGLGSKTIVSAVRKRVFSQKVELLLLLETKKVSISEDGIQKKWLVKCKGVFVVDSAVNGGFVDIEISKASQDGELNSESSDRVTLKLLASDSWCCFVTC
ncbi:hypothetical protein V6N13_004581 [Hibiscus sabdariffa]